ncbi:MAG: cation:proton antiporter, partial [Oscillospiraceae bacterium]
MEVFFILTSIALIFLIGMFLGWLFKSVKLPTLLGMIITGIIIGPCFLNLISPSLISIAPELRQIALVIILTRAGLSLDVNQLKKAGRPALLMCFLPATFEIIATAIFAPLLFNISYIEAALIGSVIAAVSPAVVVPRMIKIIDEGYGQDKQIPQIIMAGASADDVYVIVLFTSFSAILSGKNASMLNFIQIPTSILLGIILGVIVGTILVLFFKKVHIRDSSKVIIITSVAFLIMGLENLLKNYVSVSGLIAIMVVGMTMYAKYSVLAKRLSLKYNNIWIAAE